LSDAERLLSQLRRAAERGDRLDVAWLSTQAIKAGADRERVDDIRAEVRA